MKAPESENKFELCPTGNYVGRCYLIVDLGTQKTTYQGEEKEKRQLFLGFELPGKKMEDGRPFAVGSFLTFSMDDRSNLYKLLAGWSGKKLSEDHDISTLLGDTGLVNIGHNESGGKTYVNILGISPVPEGMPIEGAVNEAVLFDFDNYSGEALGKLSEGIQKIVKKSKEWQSLDPAKDAKEILGGEVVDNIPF